MRVLGRVAEPFRLRVGPATLRSMVTSSSSSAFDRVHIKRGDQSFDAYVLGEPAAPGVIVLQEWWGVDYEVKNHAALIASKGFRTLIPDLYRGKVGLDAAEAQHLMDGLDWSGAVKDVADSVNWLKQNGSSKVGVTGFCMGGALSLASGVLVPGLDAAVAFYGTPPPELADVSKLKIPVQAHFGELDNIAGFSDKKAARELEEKLKVSGVNYEMHMYPGVGHAFLNSSPEGKKRKADCGFGGHEDAAVSLAWSRFEAWLRKYLQP
ncbi:hypothetical protein GOP47_0024736 [Adiantum capillus-veneris]|uniref:Dienelactone hydrolase domain-containing protein n=1 Tax=Adiantum capillus-veneris TaxID=13818 RepID=A0A9D4U4Z4_ADICA|nr:hypothetical protein GOP47_0024736 [Adiantum capillus-veneris]